MGPQSLVGLDARSFWQQDQEGRRIQHLPVDEAGSKRFRGQAGPIAIQSSMFAKPPLDFVQVPGFPSTIRALALTHSRVLLFNAGHGLSLSR
jgi:hypothetical protein